ncbi:hypothetical protein GCM10009574_058540 [Streptomyces asiaticus]|uniref:Integrase n=2 Tax=Streptomyces rhizosphaericus TaxID=114699 RepID=A0ABN1S4T7_9ACTN
MGHTHIGVTATVYAHVRLRLQRDAIDLLGHALRNPAEITGKPGGGDEPPSAQPPSADVAVNYCRQTSQRPHRDIIPVGPLGLSLAVIDRESPAGRPSFASEISFRLGETGSSPTRPATAPPMVDH